MNKSIIMVMFVGIVAAALITSTTIANSDLLAKDKIEGTDGNDILFGTSDDDTINSGDGNDEAFGESGDDKIKTGKGDDNNFGEAGDDKLSAGQGNDFLQGKIGADKYKCGSGHDSVAGFDETEGDKATGNCEVFGP
jgi:Ca2+-binding RTX toxin-like protein